jgi:hypothetical protein
VGWTTWEELNRIPDVTTVRNYGWPCYEGGDPQPAYAALNMTACDSLYQDEGGVGTKFARGIAPKLRRWTHLALTYDGTTIRRYVNGALAGTQSAKGALAGGSYPLRFGGNAVWKEWFKGRLDEVRVYYRAVTAEQLRADMTKPINPKAKKARAAKRAKGGANVKRYRGGRSRI